MGVKKKVATEVSEMGSKMKNCKREPNYRAQRQADRARVFPHSATLLLVILVCAIFGIVPATAQTNDSLATFFMGRVKYSSNDGNDCGGVGQDLMKLVSRTSTLKIQEEKKVRLTDEQLYET